MKKTLFSIVLTLSFSTSTYAGSLNIFAKGNQDNSYDMKIISISTQLPESVNRDLIEIRGTGKSKVISVHIHKQLLINLNMNTASFMQLLMDKSSDVELYCTGAQLADPRLGNYNCAGVAVNISEK